MTPEEHWEKICEPKFTTMLSEIKETNKGVKELHNRLFVGNGKEPMDVQIDRLNTFKKIAIWLGGVSFVALLGLIARIIHELIVK